MIHKRSWKVLICLLLQLTISAIYLGSYPAQALSASGKPQLSINGNLYLINNINGNMWTKTKSQKMLSVDDVQDYLLVLNEGEYSDWRLPNKQELYDLFTIFDMKKNGEIKIRIEGSYWLRNDAGEFISGAWEIGDGCGPERIFYPAKGAHIMAIRP